MKNKKTEIIMLISTVMFVILAINVKNHNVDAFNNYCYENFIFPYITPSLTSFMIGVTDFGNGVIYVIIILILLLLNKTRYTIGVPLAVTLITSVILNFVVKNIISNPRPDINRLVNESGFGFPSAHVMNGTVFVGFALYLFFPYIKNKISKIILLIFSIIYILILAYSRVYLGVHYTTDVLGGIMAGITVISVGIVVIEKINDKKYLAKIG